VDTSLWKKEISRFKRPASEWQLTQYIYAISNRWIGKYDKRSGKLVQSWIGDENGPIIHLDGGIVLNGRLFCAHSNHPRFPIMTSSIDIWDAETLQHIESHSFGIQLGSCTWLDRYDGHRWVCFAHYDKWKHRTGKGTEWTTLVKYDDQWHNLGSWIFPDTVISSFHPMSNSGGSWGPDNYLYCAGHDCTEVYVMDIPDKGSVLKLVDILQIKIHGQGIAWDRSEKNILYGVRRKTREVVKSKMTKIG